MKFFIFFATGSGQVRLRATNHFSSMEVDVNTSGSGDSDTSVKAFDKTYKMKTKKVKLFNIS